MSSLSHSCYAVRNADHRWQGDVYESKDFEKGSFPIGSDKVSHWMLMNRTCHMVTGEGRSVKILYLTFCTCVPIARFFKSNSSDQSIKNQIKNVVTGRDENIIYLPKDEKLALSEDYVVDFNMVWSVSAAKCPDANKKCVQLSSPFCEHLMQRFSRWFFSIGFDDRELRKKENLDRIQKRLEEECQF